MVMMLAFPGRRLQSKEVAAGLVLNDQHDIPFVMNVTALLNHSSLIRHHGVMIGMAHP